MTKLDFGMLLYLEPILLPICTRALKELKASFWPIDNSPTITDAAGNFPGSFEMYPSGEAYSYVVSGVELNQVAAPTSRGYSVVGVVLGVIGVVVVAAVAGLTVFFLRKRQKLKNKVNVDDKEGTNLQEVANANTPNQKEIS